MPTTPSEDEVLTWFDQLSNWGRWGDDDRLGTLNHVTPARRVAAAQLVREGVSVSCAWDMRTGRQPGATVENQRYMLSTGLGLADEGRRNLLGEGRAGGAQEFIGMVFHGHTITHVDSLCHFMWDGKMYNGASSTLIDSRDGAMSHDVTAAKQGILTRGVNASSNQVTAPTFARCHTPQASSISINSWRWASCSSSTIPPGCPNVSTATIALVRGVIAASTLSTSMFRFCGSISTSTGLAPTYSTQLVEATKLNGVVITSSPGPTPAASMAQCNPPVPDDTPTPWRRPATCAQASSNFSSLPPIVRVLVCNTSTTASISACVMSGWDKGMAVVCVCIRMGSSGAGGGRGRPPPDEGYTSKPLRSDNQDGFAIGIHRRVVKRTRPGPFTFHKA